MIWWPFNKPCVDYQGNHFGRNSPMIWWPFNHLQVQILNLVSRNSPMIWWPFNKNVPKYIEDKLSRNSPMIWWPFNTLTFIRQNYKFVVTHQWSGDHSISMISLWLKLIKVVTHQWSGDHSILFWKENFRSNSVVTHQWSGDHSISEPAKFWQNDWS